MYVNRHEQFEIQCGTVLNKYIIIIIYFIYLVSFAGAGHICDIC